MGCVGYAVFKRTGKKRYLLAFFSSCAFLTPAATGMSLQYTPCFYISMLGSLFCLLKSEWILQKNRRYFLFLLLGVMTCYFDFLTYPLLCFAFPFCWLMVSAEKELTANSKVALLFGGGLSFVFGYGGFFVMKWIVQAIVLHTDSIWHGISTVFFHIGDLDEEYRLLHQNYSRIDSLYNNFRHYFYPLFVIILSIWMIILIYKFLCGGLKLTLDNITYVAVTLTSPAWYFIINTHTGIHHLFTYRIYGASILGFMLFVCSTFDKNGSATHSVRSYIKKVGVLGVYLALGLCASRIAKEDIATINGGDYSEFHLKQEDVMEFEFTPSISDIKGFSLCIEVYDSVSGEIHIEIIEGDIVCEKLSIPIATYQKQNFEIQLADWRLLAGKQYVMKVYITDNSDGVKLLVTPEGVRPQTEYGKALFNETQTLDIAPLSGIVYRGHIQPIHTKLYLAMCGGVFFLICWLAIQTLWENKVRLRKKEN